MREILGFKNVDLRVSGGIDLLLKGASFSFSTDSRVALVGSNGSGKSTLLKFLAGMIEPDAGTLIRPRNSAIEYVPQFVPDELVGKSLIAAVLEKIVAVRPELEEWRGYDILNRFGFEGAVLERPMEALSGGEANRALLARALVVNPDFLLLDEPTNHMDSEAIIRFERLVKEELRVPFCVVSHDRQLLDSCAPQTIFIRDMRLYFFGLPYSEAKQALLDHDTSQADRLKYEEKEIRRLTETANRMQGWVKKNSDLATTYQNIRRRVEKMKENRTFVSKEKKKRLSLGDSALEAQAAIRVENFAVTVPDGKELYKVPNLVVSPGDRIAILGRNGAGKTSLLRNLLEQFERHDTAPGRPVKFNPQVRIGYYDQDLRLLDPEATIFEHMARVCNTTNDRIKKELITAGFEFRRHDDLIKTLSGGQKSRLQFVVLKLLDPNVLFLDEPTNHIDVEGIEHLEDEIESSNATFVMVSHDRRFIENVANRFFLIQDGKLAELGSAEDYYLAIQIEAEGS